MSLPTSFIHIDRHAAWGARPACVAILLGFVGVIAAGALLEPGRAEPQAALEATAMIGAVASSPCAPHDAVVGNEGGDPYGFYVFSRDHDLAAMRAACTRDVADGQPDGADRAAQNMLAQNDPPGPLPAPR